MQHPDLEQKLNSLRNTDPRNAAEYAFALAKLHQQEGDEEKAIQLGREAISLLDKCPLDTLADCAQRNPFIAGVAIPDLFHQAVVRDRLQPLAL